MGLTEILLLISLNFNQNAQSILNIATINNTIESIDITSTHHRPDELPDYPTSATPFFIKGPGTEFSITWEYTVRVTSDNKVLMDKFYNQLSEYLGCTINRYSSFYGCFGSSSYGKSINYKRQRYLDTDIKVMGGLVTEVIDEGQLRSIYGTFDTHLNDIPYLEPQVTEDEAIFVISNYAKTQLHTAGAVNSLGLYIDREYNSPVNLNNKLYYVIEVYFPSQVSPSGGTLTSYYMVDAQKPVFTKFYGDTYNLF